MKQCTVCKKMKSKNNFYVYKKALDGLQYTCKDCQKEYNKKWDIKNPTYRKEQAIRLAPRMRELQLKRKYNITIEQYDKMIFLQKGVCAICGNPPKVNKNLSIDHCHRTGKIRQLLCLTCNALLGNIENGKVPIEKFFKYIEKHKKKTKKERKKVDG